MFNYTLRAQAQWVQGYASGGVLVQRWRLSNIMSCTSAANGVCASTHQARFYQLNYATSASGSGEDTLTQVRECHDHSTTVCSQPTQFTWSTGQHEFATLERPAAWATDLGQLLNYRLGDVDGDGRMDIVYLRPGGNGCSWGAVVVGLSRLDGAGRPVMQGWSRTCLPADVSTRGEGAWHLLDL